jgi:hypothetical protein
MSETYFKISVVNVAGRTSFVVKGDGGELRSSFPDKQIAKLHCAQLNAAFAIGQRETMKEQLDNGRAA